MIRDIVAEFSVSVIVVLGHERLYNDMARRFSGKLGLSVVKLARSGGAVETNDAYLQQLQNYVTKQYFYGELKNVLSPVSRTLDFKTIKVYRLAESTFIDSAKLTFQLGTAATHASALPIGQEESVIAPEIELVQLESPAVLQHSILAITSVGIDEDPRGVLESNVLGFIFV
jgi:polyribonucleotide 5'-hydroxyl-kinase